VNAVMQPLPILGELSRRPSRASAAAIGHRFILNGASPALRIAGIRALGPMVCDWSVAILEMAICDPARGLKTRLCAVRELGSLLKEAISRGYCRLTWQGCSHLVEAACREVDTAGESVSLEDNPVVEELCGHVSQAVADGYFGTLPDF
jgi:hypothetical protein